MTVSVFQGKFIMGPRWNIVNTISLPTSDNSAPDGSSRFRTAVQFVFLANLMLDNIFNTNAQDSRTLGEDQLNVFRSIEDSLATMGVDGRNCLLRLICELQSNPIGEFTVIGEILTVLFTPKRGINDFLQEYIEAEIAGSEGEHCPSKYSTCPFSLMNTIKQYRRFAQGFSTTDDRPEVANPQHSPLDVTKNYFQIPQVIYQ